MIPVSEELTGIDTFCKYVGGGLLLKIAYKQEHCTKMV